MDSKPLAIIIPAYKQTYFRETLQSISLQSCTNFTLYIGDDCSPYDLRSIIYEFESKIDIVYHRFEENLGSKDLVAHWDRCIALSQGEPYIWLFSDDDMMESRCVEEFLKLPKETRDNHLVHFDTYIMDEATGSSTTTRPFPALITPMDFLEEKLRINKKQGLEIFVVEFIFSREVYENEHKFQTYDLAWGSDFITWLKFSSSKKGIFTIKATECHIIWRKSLENITPNQSHPITLRKLSSLVYNAAYINTWLKENHHLNDTSCSALRMSSVGRTAVASKPAQTAILPRLTATIPLVP